MRKGQQEPSASESLSADELRRLTDLVLTLAELRDSRAEVPAGTASPADVLLRMQWLAARAVAGDARAVHELRRFLASVEPEGRTRSADLLRVLGSVPARQVGIPSATIADVDALDAMAWTLFLQTIAGRVDAILCQLSHRSDRPRQILARGRWTTPDIRRCRAAATPYSATAPPCRTAASPSGARLVQAA